MKHKILQKGFTLIEALVAVAMLSIVIVSVMGLAQSGIASNTYSQAQVSANYLAGEAVEYIRNIRDQNFLAGRDWLTGITDTSCVSPHGCDVDTVNHTIVNSCNANGCPALKFDPTLSSGFYQHVTGSNSSFTRTVMIEQISTNEIAVRVVITGSSGYFKQTPMVVVEHLFNWYNS